MPKLAEVIDEVSCPAAVPVDSLREGFTRSLGRLTLGIVTGRPDGFWLGPVPLIRLGPAESDGARGVRWPIVGGLLTGRAGGFVGFEVDGVTLRGYVRAWAPSLPWWVYSSVQLPVHHELTRLYLLHVRGRDPLPAPAAKHDRRLAAAAIDLALCFAVAGGRWRRFAGVAAAYHVAGWTLAGQTVGGALLGQRLVAVDGSPVTVGQAVARLLLAPFGSRQQDAAAATAVVATD